MFRYDIVEPWEANDNNGIERAQALFDGEVSGLLDEENGILAYGPTNEIKRIANLLNEGM